MAQFHRGQRYQILPAYCQQGILLARVFQGSTDAAFFEDFEAAVQYRAVVVHMGGAAARSFRHLPLLSLCPHAHAHFWSIHTLRTCHGFLRNILLQYYVDAVVTCRQSANII